MIARVGCNFQRSNEHTNDVNDVDDFAKEVRTGLTFEVGHFGCCNSNSIPTCLSHYLKFNNRIIMRSLTISTLVAAFVAVATMFSFVQAEAPLDLGLAAPYAILAGSTVTSSGVAGTVVTGKIGVFPGNDITGFPPAVLVGTMDSANGAAGSAKGDLTTAYNVLAGKAFDVTLSNQDLGGMILTPGVYKFDKFASMTGMLTLDALGDAAAVWTFQVGSSLLIAEGSSILFKDSIGNPDYVYWQVGTSATLAKGVPMIGNILALASITVSDGATVMGRCLARNAAVTLDRSVLTAPALVSFRAQQRVTGVSAEQYNNNVTLNSMTMKQAIAKTMPSTTPANIGDLGVSAGPTSAKTMISLESFRLTRHLSTSSIILDYVVSIYSTMSSDDLQSQLTTAIENGKFNEYLQVAAFYNGATDLQTSSSDTIETVNIEPEVEPSNKNGGLTENEKAGICIGVIVGVAVLAALIYYFAFHRGATSAVVESHKSTTVATQEV